VDVPQNLYDGFLSENTKINDKAREKKIDQFFKELCEVPGHFAYLKNYRDYIVRFSKSSKNGVLIFFENFRKLWNIFLFLKIFDFVFGFWKS